jgi:hypothetical protein
LLSMPVHLCMGPAGPESKAMSKALIAIGLVIFVVGLLWPWLGRIGLGRLPGDIFIQRDNFTFYAPLTTGVLFSLLLSLIFWIINR